MATPGLGQRCHGHRRHPVTDTRTARPRRHRRLYWQPLGLQCVGQPGHWRFLHGHGQPAYFQLRHPGLRQQVCRRRSRVRHQHPAPGTGYREHRLPAHVRRKSESLTHELYFHRRPHGQNPYRLPARRPGLLHQPPPDRIRQPQNRESDTNPSRHGSLPDGRPAP